MTARWHASYATGDWTAIAGSQAWMLCDLAPGSPQAVRCWTVLGEGADCLSVLSVLLDAGLDHLPSFALVGLSGDEMTLFVRGRACALVDGTRFKAAELLTWSEHRISSAATAVVLEAEDASSEGASLPLAGGVVRSCLLSLDRVTVGAPDRPMAAITEPAAQVEPAAPVESPTPVEAPASVAATEPIPPPEPIDPPAPTATDQTPDEGTATPESDPALSAATAPTDVPVKAATISAQEFEEAVAQGDGRGSEQVEDAEAPPSSEASPAPSSGSPYSELFGVTVHRRVEDAAIRDADHAIDTDETVVATPREPPAVPVSPPMIHASAPPAPSEVPDRGRAPAPSGMIDFVPGSTDLAPSDRAAPPAPPSDPTNDHGVDHPAEQGADALGFTIDRTSHAALLAQAASSPAVVGPVVQAVRCSRGHANPAHAARCRACEAPIAEQQPVTMPRPTLGVLRLSTKDLILLDRPVVMGRGPKPGHLVGGEHANVVRLPSPEQDISRSHLEIGLDGWHVTVTDLGSTNGTVVALDGRPSERLRPNQPATIEPGTVVTLAEEVSFRYEVAP